MHELIEAWKRFNIDKPPYLYEGDGILQQVATKYCCHYGGWEGYIADPEFGKPGNTKLHLDLLPMPFMGDITNASIFLLMLNPGLGANDYFGEYKVSEYRSALINNLRQEPGSDFIFLNPSFSWHAGYAYWHSKLRNVIQTFSENNGVSYGVAKSFMSANIAAIELVPYHSHNFNLPTRIIDALESVKLVQSYIHEIILPRVHDGECLLVVTRAISRWNLPSHENIIAYAGSEARSAHLTHKSRGGDAITRFLTTIYSNNNGTMRALN